MAGQARQWHVIPAGGGRDPPGRDGGGGRSGARRYLFVLLPVSARVFAELPLRSAQQETRHAPRLRRQLQPAAGGEIEAIKLSHHGSQTARAQSFLHRPESFRPVAPAHQDQCRRVKPERPETGTVGTRPVETPENVSPAPFTSGPYPRRRMAQQIGQNYGQESGGGAVPRASPDIVQGTQRQPTPGQGGIEPLVAERQDGWYPPPLPPPGAPCRQSRRSGHAIPPARQRGGKKKTALRQGMYPGEARPPCICPFKRGFGGAGPRRCRRSFQAVWPGQ